MSSRFVNSISFENNKIYENKKKYEKFELGKESFFHKFYKAVIDKLIILKEQSLPKEFEMIQHTRARRRKTKPFFRASNDKQH